MLPVILLLLSALVSVSIGRTGNEDFYPNEQVFPNDFYPNEEAHLSLPKAATSSNNLVTKLLYRHDMVSCESMAPRPSENKGTTHSAWIYYSFWQGKYRCYAWNYGRDITYGSSSKIVIRSVNSTDFPGKHESYIMQQAVVRCPGAKQFAKIDVTTSYVDLEKRQDIGDKEICVDYVRIETNHENGYSFCEICGQEKFNKSCPFITGHNSVRPSQQPIYVLFRSGPTTNGAGFKITIECIDRLEDAVQDCLKMAKKISWKKYKSIYFNRNTYAQLSSKLKHIPYDTRKTLEKFYEAYEDNSLTAPVEYYRDVLALSLIAQKSCDTYVKEVGKKVQKLYPKTMIAKLKQDTYSPDYFDAIEEE